VDAWEQVYADVLAEGPVTVDAPAALADASRYLRSLAPVLKSRTEAHSAAAKAIQERATVEAELARQGDAVARAAQLDSQMAELRGSKAWRVSTLLWRANERIRSARGPR
jgi:hypothetical protein